MGRGLGWVTHRGPCQPRTLCESVTHDRCARKSSFHRQTLPAHRWGAQTSLPSELPLAPSPAFAPHQSLLQAQSAPRLPHQLGLRMERVTDGARDRNPLHPPLPRRRTSSDTQGAAGDQPGWQGQVKQTAAHPASRPCLLHRGPARGPPAKRAGERRDGSEPPSPIPHGPAAPPTAQRRPHSAPKSPSQKYLGPHGARDVLCPVRGSGNRQLVGARPGCPRAPGCRGTRRGSRSAWDKSLLPVARLWSPGRTGRTWELLGFSSRHFSLFRFLLIGQGSSSGWL